MSIFYFFAIIVVILFDFRMPELREIKQIAVNLVSINKACKAINRPTESVLCIFIMLGTRE